jgi:hypothetical protein
MQTADGIPEAVAGAIKVMSGYPAPWALCGGWAVDAWLGRQTREHGDVDVSVFADDQRTLFEHLNGWQLLAHDAAWEANENEKWWDGRRSLNYPSHIHARPPERSGAMPEGGIAKPEDGFTLDVMIDGLSGDEWVLSRDPRITLPLRKAVKESIWGMPIAVPQVLLFFKAKDFIRRRDQLDFAALLPQLSVEERDWLRSAIETIGHPWLREMKA